MGRERGWNGGRKKRKEKWGGERERGEGEEREYEGKQGKKKNKNHLETPLVTRKDKSYH